MNIIDEEINENSRESMQKDSGNVVEEVRFENMSFKIKRYISEDIFNKLTEEVKLLLAQRGDDAPQSFMVAVSKIPWGEKESVPDISLKEAQEILEKSHFGLESIKHRVLCYIACQKRLKGSYGKILLFCGPAGVGKTSIVHSIAKAMGKQVIKISLAGVSDADILKGTSGIYSNSRPGRIIDAIISSQSFSPIILLDEIDKVAKSESKGNPQYALIDILDSDQSRFVDECLGFPINISHAIFIATANDAHEISPILLNRMELINISGYTEEEKIEIIKDYVLPEFRKQYKFEENDADFGNAAIKFLIRNYSKEPGLRKVKNVIAQIFEELVYCPAAN